MRGRTNILARPYPIINCDVEEFIAEEDIEIGSFVEPIYESDVNNDFFQSDDTMRKILRVVGNYFIIAFVDGEFGSSGTNLYSIGVFEFTNGTFIPCSNIVTIGLSSVGGLINYSENIYLICGRGYGDEYGYAKMCKFHVNMETFEIYDYENFFISKNEGTIGSNNLFIVDGKIEFVFFYSKTTYTSTYQYFKTATLIKNTFDNIDDFSSMETVSNTYDSGYGTKVNYNQRYNVMTSVYQDDLIRIGNDVYAAAIYRDSVSSVSGLREYREICLFDFNDLESNGRLHVKTLGSYDSSSSLYLDNLFRTIMIDKKNNIWTYGGGRVYKGKELIKSISQLGFGTSKDSYKCMGSYVEDGLCILFLYNNVPGSTYRDKQKAFALEYDEVLDSITFSNEIFNKNIWASRQCVKISDDRYLLFKEKGWMIVSYKDGVLVEGNMLNKVKNYTSNSRIIGFTKNGGSAGDIIQVYVPKDKS